MTVTYSHNSPTDTHTLSHTWTQISHFPTLTHNCTYKSRHLFTYRHRHLQRPSSHTLIHTHTHTVHFHIHIHSRHLHTFSHTFKLSHSYILIHTPTQTTHSRGETHGGAGSLTHPHTFTTLQIHIHTHNFHICTLMHTPGARIGTGCFTYSQSHKLILTHIGTQIAVTWTHTPITGPLPHSSLQTVPLLSPPASQLTLRAGNHVRPNLGALFWVPIALS